MSSAETSPADALLAYAAAERGSSSAPIATIRTARQIRHNSNKPVLMKTATPVTPKGVARSFGTHPPAFENCANCHEPHGTVNDRLLKVTDPRLCTQCHLSVQGILSPRGRRLRFSSLTAAAPIVTARSMDRIIPRENSFKDKEDGPWDGRKPAGFQANFKHLPAVRLLVPGRKSTLATIRSVAKRKSVVCRGPSKATRQSLKNTEIYRRP